MGLLFVRRRGNLFPALWLALFVFFCYIFCLVSSSKSNARLFEFSPGDVKRKEEAGPSSEGAIGILITL